jgi:hypothetical protein
MIFPFFRKKPLIHFIDVPLLMNFKGSKGTHRSKLVSKTLINVPNRLKLLETGNNFRS